MFLTISKKSPFYQITHLVGGKRTTVSTKTADRPKAEEFLKNFIKSTNVESKAQQPKNDSSIDLKTFEEEYRSFLSSTHSQSYIKRSIKPAFKKLIEILGNIKLNELSVKDLDKFISETSKNSQSSAALYYRTLKAAFNKAIAWEYISENPLKKIKPPKVSKSLPVFINNEEFNKIIELTDKKFLKDIFTVAYYTGMRLGEVLNLKWGWIDFSNNLITVKNSKSFTTKSKKERIIPINLKVEEIFLELLNNEQHSSNKLLFYNSKGLVQCSDEISKKFKQCVLDARLNSKIHFHTLRHSFASNLVQKGVSLYVVKELLGHEDLKTTQIYSHLRKQDLIDAVNLSL